MDNFASILSRVKEKQQDYASYDFAKLEMAALNTFFDLAQEYDDLHNLYLVSIAVPLVFMEVHSVLYMIDHQTEAISSVATSQLGLVDGDKKCPPFIKITDMAYEHGTSYIVPIHGRRTPASRLLFHGTGNVIGILEVIDQRDLPETERFFLQKYANRIGYNLYNKTLAEQNIQHLKFINNLVADIEHNVIVPNLRYKYYFRKIRKYLNTNKDIEADLENILEELKSHNPDLYVKLSGIVEGMEVINRAIFGHQEKIETHYKNASLFLESLFRRDHFLFGQYILDKKSCYLWKDIVLPQLERYSDQLTERSTIVRPTVKGHKKDFQVKVDKGLMAQVVANLLSNAVKYTESVSDKSGKWSKICDCKTSLVEDFFGQGHHGVRFQVFSTGPPIDQNYGDRIFDEGFRLPSKHSAKGTGHGLHFVKNVVEVHGGIVGHRARKLGNEFYFIIPV